MKSLEIVNLCLEELLNNKTEICEYDLLQIKQDLEVLEIFRKYSVLHFDDEFENQLEQRIFSGIDFEELDEEELYKIKQWLEENENEWWRNKNAINGWEISLLYL